MNYMWKEERGKNFYRFQTDDKLLADKMKRRKKFKLVGWGVNCPLWIYQALFTRPDIARKAFKTITGRKIDYDVLEEIFFSESNLSNIEKQAA